MKTAKILKPEGTAAGVDVETLETIINETIIKLEGIKETHELKTDSNKDQYLTNGYYFKSWDILDKHIKYLEDLKETLKDLTVNEFLNYFFLKIGNMKLNELVYNVAPYHLCNSFLNQACLNCGICYAAKNEKYAGVMKSRLRNYLFIEYVTRTGNYFLLTAAVQKVNFKKLLSTYNSSVRQAARKAQDKEGPEEAAVILKAIINSTEEIRGLRINETGELEDRHETYINILISELETLLNLKFLYTYTHNRELNTIKFKRLNINESLNDMELLNMGPAAVKEILETRNIYLNVSAAAYENIIKYLETNNIKYVSCAGSCIKCNLCKKCINRVIININH